MKRFISFKCVPIYGLMFRILTRFHALYFGASCIYRNSIVWRRVNLARFPYWPEKRMWRIARYSYLMETFISSEYGLTISGHVIVLSQWLSEINTDYIIIRIITPLGDFPLHKVKTIIRLSARTFDVTIRTTHGQRTNGPRANGNRAIGRVTVIRWFERQKWH